MRLPDRASSRLAREPQAPRNVPRVGLPPLVGVAPVIELPGSGARDIPMIDFDSVPDADCPERVD